MPSAIATDWIRLSIMGAQTSLQLLIVVLFSSLFFSAYALNEDGNISGPDLLWEMIYGCTEPLIQTNGVLGIAQADDGGYVMMLDKSDPSTYHIGDHNAFLLKVDVQGNKLWEKEFPGQSCGVGIEGSSNGGFIINAEDRIIKIDSEGNTVWTFRPNGSIEGFTALPEGGCIILTDGAGLLRTTWLRILDAEGKQAWARQLIREEYGYAHLDIYNDDSLILAGDAGIRKIGPDGYMDTIVPMATIATDIQENLDISLDELLDEWGIVGVVAAKDGGCLLHWSWGWIGQRNMLTRLGPDMKLAWHMSWNKPSPRYRPQVDVERWSDDFVVIDQEYLMRISDEKEVIWKKRYDAIGFTPSNHAIVASGSDLGGFFFFPGPVSIEDENLVFTSVYQGVLQLVKMDELGNTVWDKTYGRIQISNDIVGSEDGGFVIAGSQQTSGPADAHIFKVDSEGEVVWERSYGGQGWESAECIETTQDGGYFLAGYTTSYGQGGHDVYLVRANSDGYKVWEEVYGTPYNDQATSISRSGDGGFIIVGTAESPYLDSSYIYVLKVNPAGQKIWETVYGGIGYTTAHDITKLPHSIYLIVGTNRPSYDSWEERICAVWIDELSGKQVHKTLYEYSDDWCGSSLRVFASDEGATITRTGNDYEAFRISEWGEVECTYSEFGPNFSSQSRFVPTACLGVCDQGIILASKNRYVAVAEDIDKYACSKCFANHTLVRISNQGESVSISQLRDTELTPIPIQWDEDGTDLSSGVHIHVSIDPRSVALGNNGTFAIIGQRTLGWDWSGGARTYVAAFRDPSLIGVECSETHILTAILLLIPVYPTLRCTRRTRPSA